jgi:DNA-binding NarL/FixJ family response regulator
MTNIVVIAKDNIFRLSLEMAIDELQDWCCLLSSPSAEHFLANVLPNKRIHFAFVDVELPDGSGFDLIPILLAHSCNVEIVMTSNKEARDAIFKSIRWGANSFVLKDQLLHEFPQIVQTVEEGGSALSPKAAKILLEIFKSNIQLLNFGEDSIF